MTFTKKLKNIAIPSRNFIKITKALDKLPKNLINLKSLTGNSYIDNEEKRIVLELRLSSSQEERLTVKIPKDSNEIKYEVYESSN